MLFLATQMYPFASAGLISVSTCADIAFASDTYVLAAVHGRSPKHSVAASAMTPTYQNQHDDIEDSEHVHARSSWAYFSTSFFNPKRGNCTVILASSPSPSRW